MVYLISGLPDRPGLELHNLFLKVGPRRGPPQPGCARVVIAVLGPTWPLWRCIRTGSERRARRARLQGHQGGLLLLCRRSTGTFAITEGGSVSPPRVWLLVPDVRRSYFRNLGPPSELPLAQAERHIREGKARVARQAALVRALERHGYSVQAELGRRVLANLKRNLEMSLKHRKRFAASKPMKASRRPQSRTSAPVR